MLYPLKNEQSFPCTDKMRYTSSNITYPLTPIWVAAFGALVPITGSAATVEAEYQRFGRLSGIVTGGITITKGDPIYYITATGLLTNIDPGGAGFLLGQALEGGTPGSSVTVELNFYLLATSGAAVCTTVAASGNVSVGGTLAVTGVTTQTGALNVTGAITGASTLKATKINATSGRAAELIAASSVNTTGPATAAPSSRTRSTCWRS